MARPIVRAASGTVLAKRVNAVKFSISDVTSVDFDNPVTFDLLACAEAMAEEVVSTGGTTAGTDVATVPLYSKIVGLRLNMLFQGQGGEQVRWQLCKNPDDDITTANYNTNWHTSTDETVAREVRQNQMAKGLVVVASDKLNTTAKVFVKRSNLKRLGAMKENDKIQMVFAKDATATTVQVTVWGTIYVRANA